MSDTPKRQHIVESAGYWFNGARGHQDKGKMSDALMAMENAYNHVENALAATQTQLQTALAERDEARKAAHWDELISARAERDDALARLAEVTNLIALHLIDNKNLRADLAALTLANAEMRKALTQVMEISESIRPDLPLPTILKLLAQRHAVYTAALSSPPALAKVLADAMDLAQKLRSAADSLNSADLADALITALAPYVTKL